MTAFDYAVLAIIGLSVLIGLARGFVREVFALACWILAFFVAQWLAVPLSPLMPDDISNASLRLLSSFVVSFVLTLIVSKLAAILIVKLIAGKRGLGPADRGLGAVFGVARGGLIVMIAVLACGLTAAPKSQVWRDAMLAPSFEAAVDEVKPWLPADLAKRIQYD